MIASLTGSVLGSGIGWVHLGVNGVGFRVEVPQSARVAPHGAEVTLYTNLIVREDSLTLYGFDQPDDRDGFEVLMSVSGIGPRLALAAIDAIGLSALQRAVASQDLTTLQKIPGVGKKTAQRMVLEIGEKLGAPTVEAGVEPAAGATDSATRASVAVALEQLGWQRSLVERTLDELPEEYLDTESMLRAALSTLGAQRGF
ncbi:Holliday junction branch migration protein RuvA [Actinomyces minihominis]|uniref:Holliday junction branch migration protein RuvA n=1 Tax=Actinomyces minihominis TaxID=2002838 RepID=UPI000C0893C6|nr:Holliday junction branch migration protein RuvA [Actinomyces minihominis]